MPLDEARLNDKGTVFRLTIEEDGTAVDVSAATTQEIIFEKPDGTTVVKTTEFYTDGTDGIVEYTTLTADLDTAGKWRIQAFVETPGGEWHSEIKTFWVRENLPRPT